MNTYAGESHHKKLARGLLYCQFRLWNKVMKGSRGRIVTLAGPEAIEVEIIRDYLEWPRDRVLFVDTDATGLRCAEKKWPGVPVLHGSIEEQLDEICSEEIALLHLDLMGHVKAKVFDLVTELSTAVEDGGIIALTFLRGRENFSGPDWQVIRNAACKRLGMTLPPKDSTIIRSAGYMGALLAALNGFPYNEKTALRPTTHFRPGITTFYHSGVSPMGMVSTYCWPVNDHERLEALKVAHPIWCQGIKFEIDDDRLPMWIADRVKAGLTTPEKASQLYAVPRSTISAWLAHSTRGSYADLDHRIPKDPRMLELEREFRERKPNEITSLLKDY